MTTVNIYLTFPGNCQEAFDYYKTVFGGEYPYVGTFADMPPQEGMPPMTDEQKSKIMHISLPISKETILMGSDMGGNWAPELKIGNNFAISVNTDTKVEADRIFNALADGGSISMPMADTFWNSYFGMTADKFGINWMLNCDLKAS